MDEGEASSSRENGSVSPPGSASGSASNSDTGESQGDDFQGFGGGREDEDEEAAFASGDGSDGASSSSSSSQSPRREATPPPLFAPQKKTLPSNKKGPAWSDPSDQNIKISLRDDKRLRKLRTSLAEDEITGREYERKLRQQ